ncbi:ras-related protein Rab-40B [Lingula anatina]|uniref:small monomeric GTPase n=1 Tax=Lingula anatina TaxID=7574 RepID=A0A1S3JBA9_LINAN|nr:ras-related protein Rab-40B [Lingula anatina]|eukprot:XP_013407687.1 ras-related protein Rab-40B [Lingula anatina]
MGQSSRQHICSQNHELKIIMSSPSSNGATGGASLSPTPSMRGTKPYDYLLKFLLVGDADVGKEELMSEMEDGSVESPYCGYKTTTILLDGKRVKLQIWDTSGQGRFCTIFRSYSRGAQGILLVYDITNKWSFDGIDRWIKEIDDHAPGVPKILVGNRLHLAYKRQVSENEAEAYAVKNGMAFFEVSPLCDFNIIESFAELSRVALRRNGMSRCWGPNKVLSLQEMCCKTIVSNTTVYGIEQLPLPTSIKSHLKSYLQANKSRSRMQSFTHRDKHKKPKILNPSDSPPANCRKSCVIS